MSDGEAFVRAFHDARPGVTAAGFLRGGSYDRLAAAIPPGTRVLDLACGDGALLDRLAARGTTGVGLDVSAGEARAAARRGHAVVQGRAQALPFPAGAFDVVACHLAWMLLADLPTVASEVARVLGPGGALWAVLGGGPVAAPIGAPPCVYERWLAELGPLRAAAPPPSLGDRRAARLDGWSEILGPAGFAHMAHTRFEVCLDGTPREIFAVLSTSYDAARVDPAALAAAFARAIDGALDAHGRVPLRAVMWLAHATRA